MNRLHVTHVSVIIAVASLGTIYLGGCASYLSEDSAQSEQEIKSKCTKGTCADSGTHSDSGSDSGSATKPNVLLIVADEVAVNNVGAYKADVPGSSPPPTPTIDGLAASGVRFRQAWANPLCSPTRATLHTGRYGFRTGVGSVVASDGSRDLPTSETTLPEMMATGGYASALIGKWHLGTSAAIGGNDAPRTAGWGYFAGGLDGALSPSFTNWTRYEDGVGAKSRTYATTQNVTDALAWIGKQSGNWLATVAFNAAHDPWHTPTKGLYTSDLSTISDCEASTETMRSCYKADIEAMDSEIANLLKGVDLTTTMVIFVGDNGTPSEVVDDGYDSTRAKGTVYQGGVLVPLIISGPQVKNGGRVIDDLVNLTDVFATIGEIGGVTTTTGTDSHSLMPYIARTTTSPRAYAYTEVFTGTTPDSAGGSAAIRDAQYKVIESAGTMTECYDLTSDAWETKNLITATSTPAACTTLYAQMTALR